MTGRVGVNPGLLPAFDYDYHRAMVELEINQKHLTARQRFTEAISRPVVESLRNTLADRL